HRVVAAGRPAGGDPDLVSAVAIEVGPQGMYQVGAGEVRDGPDRVHDREGWRIVVAGGALQGPFAEPAQVPVGGALVVRHQRHHLGVATQGELGAEGGSVTGNVDAGREGRQRLGRVL